MQAFGVRGRATGRARGALTGIGRAQVEDAAFTLSPRLVPCSVVTPPPLGSCPAGECFTLLMRLVVAHAGAMLGGHAAVVATLEEALPRLEDLPEGTAASFREVVACSPQP